MEILFWSFNKSATVDELDCVGLIFLERDGSYEAFFIMDGLGVIGKEDGVT